MSEKKLFLLPDLGEGLPDAEIVEWHVKVGDVVRLDEPLVSMETAKAVVDVPSPFSGLVTRLAGKAGDVITTGAWLAEVELDPKLPQRADALAKDGISAEVIDVATLTPLDFDTIRESVAKTGRCVIVHEAAKRTLAAG